MADKTIGSLPKATELDSESLMVTEQLGEARRVTGELLAEYAKAAAQDIVYADMSDLRELGLAGSEGAAELRTELARALGIGYGNAGAFVKKLKGFGIGLDELKEEIEKIRKEN